MEYNRDLKKGTSAKDTPEKRARINCLICEHFVVTWEPNAPRACEIFGFKGKGLPSATVFKVTGKPCPIFKPKPRKT